MDMEILPGRRAGSCLRRSRMTGSLLGGAVGDALGAPAAMLPLEEIHRRYGTSGIAGYEAVYGRRGAVTDNTRMALFTAEGLILSKVRPEYALGESAATAVYHACLRWLYTQDTGRQNQIVQAHGTCAVIDGILAGHREMFSPREPDPTCLEALRSGTMGTLDVPINASRGCGGLVRVAPVGLVCKDARQAFELGCACAAITHGHPDGYLPAGFLAALLAGVATGASLQDAIAHANGVLKTYAGHEACLAAIEDVLERAGGRSVLPETIGIPGAGRMAAEVLAVALYGSLTAENNFRRGVLAAVNHSGKSDACGAIAGSLLGACGGVDAIPGAWLADLELKGILAEIANDLFEQVTDGNVQE